MSTQIEAICARPGCGEPIPPERLAKQRRDLPRYHSDDCRRLAHQDRHGSRARRLGLSAHQAAAVAHATAIGALIREGFEVYVTAVPGQSADLIATRVGTSKAARVVVRVGYPDSGGQRTLRPSSWPTTAGADLLAVVPLEDGRVEWWTRVRNAWRPTDHP